MKDLTPLQTVRKLRKLFPDTYCSASIGATFYSFEKKPELGKTIYVSSNINHKSAPTFRELLEGLK